jgi:hypothetical protein
VEFACCKLTSSLGRRTLSTVVRYVFGETRDVCRAAQGTEPSGSFKPINVLNVEVHEDYFRQLLLNGSNRRASVASPL